MKKVCKIIIWLIVGIVIENICFIYFNNYYFVKKLSINSIKIGNTTLEETLLSIPKNVSDIKISYDDKYAAYSLENSVKITNLETKKDEEIKNEAGEKLVLFKWMPYKDEIFLLIHSSKDKFNYSLNQYSMISHKISNTISIDIGKFTLSDNKVAVKNNNSIIIEDIKTNSSLNGFLVKTENSGNLNYIFYLLNAGVVVQASDKANITSFYPVSFDDCFLYQKAGDNRIYTNLKVYKNGLSDTVPGAVKDLMDEISFDGNLPDQTLKLDSITNTRLIGTDEKGNAYIGSLNEDKINKLYMVSLIASAADFKIYPLKTPVEEKNIVITSDGGVFAVYKNYIINLRNSKNVKYKGGFVQISDHKLYYISNGCLKDVNI